MIHQILSFPFLCIKLGNKVKTGEGEKKNNSAWGCSRISVFTNLVNHDNLHSCPITDRLCTVISGVGPFYHFIISGHNPCSLPILKGGKNNAPFLCLFSIRRNFARADSVPLITRRCVLLCGNFRHLFPRKFITQLK